MGFLMDMVDREKKIIELKNMGFTKSRDGRSLNDLDYQEIQTERVRLPELKELEGESN